MATATKKLGDYIETIDKRNKDNLDIPLLGVSIKKELIPSIANTIGTDMTSYKIIRKGQFAYGPVTSRNGDKVSIALLNNYNKAIVSQAYTIFRIIDESILNPDYLMLWFKRSEFDRYARFKSHGSAREIFSWEEMCNVRLPIPDITKQREIVLRYNLAISNIEKNSKKIEHLQNLAATIYKKAISGIKEEVTIGEISSKVITGKTPSTSMDELWGDTVPFITIPDMHENVYIEETERSLSELGSKTQKTTIVPENSIIVSCIATVGLVGISTKKCHTNQQINSILLKNVNDIYFVYEALINNTQELKSLGEGGSATLNVSKSKFENFKIKYPSEEVRNDYSRICDPIFKTIHTLEDENRYLKAMSNVIIRSIKKISQEVS